MSAQIPAMPEMMPNARMLWLLPSFTWKTLFTCRGSSSWIGVSCAIQMPNHAVAKRVIQIAETRRLGSANGVNAEGREVAVMPRLSRVHGPQAECHALLRFGGGLIDRM